MPETPANIVLHDMRLERLTCAALGGILAGLFAGVTRDDVPPQADAVATHALAYARAALEHLDAEKRRPQP